MDRMNPTQREFLKMLGDIQEECVQAALCRKKSGSLEETLYDVTSEVIVRILEAVDGYRESGPRLRVVSEETGGSLREHPSIELHDAVCEYLKGTE